MSSSTIPFGPPLQRRREGWNEEGRKTASEATKSRRGDWKRVRCLALFPEDRETEICQVVILLWLPQTKFMEIDTYRYMVYKRQLAQVLICEIPLLLPPLDPPQDLVGRVEEFFPPPPFFIFSPRPTTDRRTPILLFLLPLCTLSNFPCEEEEGGGRTDTASAASASDDDGGDDSRSGGRWFTRAER